MESFFHTSFLWTYAIISLLFHKEGGSNEVDRTMPKHDHGI